MRAEKESAIINSYNLYYISLFQIGPKLEGSNLGRRTGYRSDLPRITEGSFGLQLEDLNQTLLIENKAVATFKTRAYLSLYQFCLFEKLHRWRKVPRLIVQDLPSVKILQLKKYFQMGQTKSS